MKTGSIVAIIIVVLAAAGLVYWYFSTQNPSYSAPAYQPPLAQTTPLAQTAPPPATPTAVTVIYTNSGFAPATVTIPKGGTVTFKNSASDGVWVASNPHPIHNGYPTTGGCVGSTFDSCRSIPPGGSWSFTFTFVGTWGYHNHLNPSEGGKVIVQ